MKAFVFSPCKVSVKQARQREELWRLQGRIVNTEERPFSHIVHHNEIKAAWVSMRRRLRPQ